MSTQSIVFAILIFLFIPFVAVFSYFKMDSLFYILGAITVLELVVTTMILGSSKIINGFLFGCAILGVESITFHLTQDTFWRTLLLGSSISACSIFFIALIALFNTNISCGGN